jgi:hypothetical protein
MQQATDAIRRFRFRSRVIRHTLAELRARSLADRDGLLVSYPRSGTTWLRFLLFELVTGSEPRFGGVGEQIPYVGRHRRTPPSLPSGGRLLFTHERPTARVPRRVVYLARDPRSVLVSEYRWQQRRRYAPGPFDRFARDFVRGATNPWGSWGDHVSSWLADPGDTVHRLVVRFEDLRADTAGQLAMVARFLGIDASDEAVARAVEHNTIERMREKEDSGVAQDDSRQDVRFVADGAIDAWRIEIPPDVSRTVAAAFLPAMERLGYDAGVPR